MMSKFTIYILFAIGLFFQGQLATAAVPLYKVFETAFTNNATYANKFRDVELEAVFTGPSGEVISWRGFYDGDGLGGGDASTGNVWKLRFMPTEVGEWNYTYTWTDGTPGGSGQFDCVMAGAGKGVLRAYENNPRWFAYEGKDPVFLKSYHLYYEGLLYHDLQWTINNVYQPLISAGYNHLQLFFFPTSWYAEGTWTFSDAPATLPKALLFPDETPSASMNLQVCNSMDGHISWLNDHNIAMLGHQGFDGNVKGPRFGELSSSEQEFYVKYMCARYAPYAMCLWNYTWETRGNGHEFTWADLLIQYDPWDHIRSYHDRYPDYGPEGEADNHFSDDRYTFANIENHVQDHTAPGQHEPWTHHLTTLNSFEGKPVYMSEGNGLWRWFWNAKEEQIHRNAWAVTMAGGSFCWLGHSEGAASTTLLEWDDAASRIDELVDIMTGELNFYKMTPQDSLLDNIVSGTTSYCLAEVGKQYLVYKEQGGSFDLNLAPGSYEATWIDARTNARQPLGELTGTGANVSFSLPDSNTEWLLMVRETTEYDRWSSENFPTTTNSHLREKMADPDLDGIPNIVEYAFALNPNQSRDERRVSLETGNGTGPWMEWIANLYLRAGDPGIQPFLEIREDLLASSWHPAANFTFSNNAWYVDSPDWNIETQTDTGQSEWSLRVKLPQLPVDAPVFLRYSVRDLSE
ncbi:DUF5060 domain-containing protein [Pontiellaceae bacterium B12219]|nr:DUF5060 domain-containing protein [Pontiellaceae bacterium B12219]